MSAAVVAMLVTAVAWAQAATQPSEPAERDGLQLVIEAPKGTFAVGEPLALNVMYRTVSTQAFRLRHEVTPSSNGDGWTHEIWTILPLTSSSAVATSTVGQELAVTSSASAAQIAALVETELASGDAREVAWGAFNAGSHGVRSAVPLLQRVLEAPPAQPMDHAHVALIDAVLDALIQLHARLPALVVAPYVNVRPVQAYILLTAAKDRDPTFLRLITTLSGNAWHCAANALLEDRAPGLAPYLLESLHLHLYVNVVDGSPRLGSGTAGSGSGSEPWLADPTGYPPHADYGFDVSELPGMVVLSAGPATVYYSRQVTNSFLDPPPDMDRGEPSDVDRVAYLQAMLTSTDPVAPPAQTSVTVRWSTAAALLEQIGTARADLERQYHGLLGTLVRNGRLATDEAAAHPPKIEVALRDQRNDQSVPLPIIRR